LGKDIAALSEALAAANKVNAALAAKVSNLTNELRRSNDAKTVR
jgi:uncharacterized coiled-coil protein SlyX